MQIADEVLVFVFTKFSVISSSYCGKDCNDQDYYGIVHLYPGNPTLDITDVRQLLSDMHTEINLFLTTNAHESILEQISSQQDKHCSSNIKKSTFLQKKLLKS